MARWAGNYTLGHWAISQVVELTKTRNNKVYVGITFT